MTSITLNELGYLWNLVPLSDIEVGEYSEEVEYKPGVHPAYGFFAWAFDVDPSAWSFDIEFSPSGSGAWIRIMRFTDIFGQTFIILAPGRYRVKLVSKTGTTEVVMFTLFAKPDHWNA